MDNKATSITKVLILDDSEPEDVAKAMIEGGFQKDPFYVFDMDEVYRRVQYFKKMMPRVEIFYAMKCNDSENMVKLAVALGLGFDCASPGEIHKMLNLGVPPESIIFATPVKNAEWMKYAYASGIRHTTFDTSNELKKIKQYWPDARLLIRVKVDNSDSMYKLGDKFGCEFEKEATDLLDEAAVLGLRVIGVAFHVGSACFSVNSYVEGLQKARELFDYEARAGRGMSIVDIGGGFLSDRHDIIDEESKAINSTLEQLFPESSVQIVAEPGRYLCDSSFNLYCSINNIRRVTRNGETLNLIYINDGVFGTLRDSVPWHTVKRFRNNIDIKNEKLEKAILWGPSCHPMDRVMDNMNVMLPPCTPLDWLLFSSQGAYSACFTSSFSCLPGPQIRSVISRQLWNKVKDCKVFSPDDFQENSNISAPLPSSIPSLVKKRPLLLVSSSLKV